MAVWDLHSQFATNNGSYFDAKTYCKSGNLKIYRFETSDLIESKAFTS